MAKSGKPVKPSKSTPPLKSAQAAKPSSPPPQKRERPSLDSPSDPLLRKIFLGVAGLGLLAMLLLSLGSGINADDKFQNDYSKKLVSYYSTFGKDTTALNIREGNMHLYGGFFEIVTGFSNKALGFTENDLAYHNVRHLWSAFFGWIAILCAALMARYVGGWRAGLMTLIIMLLSPRFIGDSLMNPKDIPFAAGYMMAVYNLAVMLDGLPNLRRWNIAGLAGGLAIALATRAGGLLPFAYLFMFAGLHFIGRNGWSALISNTRLVGRYALVAVGIAVVGYVAALLFWPYALQSPLKNPFVALSKFSELEVRIRVLYEGTNVMSNRTPWHYPLKWILYTIPLAAAAGFIGSLVLLPRLLRRYAPLWVLLVLFAAIFPVFYIIYKHSVIHDGWRHLTFAYPPMVVAAGLFWNELAEMFSGKKAIQYATYGAMGLLLADAGAFIVANAKYPYVYFNPIVGGTQGAFGEFETDYWGISVRQGIEWMEQQGILRPDMPERVIIATNMAYSAQKLTAKYGDKVKIKYLKWEKRCDDAWDYGLYPTRFLSGYTLQKGKWPPDNAVHIVEAGGAPILAVLKDNGKNCALGMAAVKLSDWNGAIENFKREIANVPDNELAWSNLAQAYMSANQLEESKTAAEKTIAISPDDELANNMLGMYWMQKNDLNQARNQFELAVKLEPSNVGAYYYLALIAQQEGDNQSALNYLMKAIQAAPNFKQAYELSARIYETMGDAGRAQQFRAALGQLK